MALFQSRNRDTSLFRSLGFGAWEYTLYEFQSRNRDTSLFRRVGRGHDPRLAELFQSRNRDTSLFRSKENRIHSACCNSVSISQSRYFSFQVRMSRCNRVRQYLVSISQSRYFSFQAPVSYTAPYDSALFQSRNRDTSLFRGAPPEPLPHVP